MCEKEQMYCLASCCRSINKCGTACIPGLKFASMHLDSSSLSCYAFCFHLPPCCLYPHQVNFLGVQELLVPKSRKSLQFKFWVLHIFLLFFLWEEEDFFIFLLYFFYMKPKPSLKEMKDCTRTYKKNPRKVVQRATRKHSNLKDFSFG